MGAMERGIDVDNEAGVVVIGDGNDVVLGTGAAVRSAYREQVRRIAPPELVGREEELAELAEFCRTGTGYRWWRADAWAGKTALMASFALAPPPGVRIVPFFVTARLGAQNDVVAYVDVVLEQLAELAGEGLPALLTAATREAHLLRLYASAAEACAARGERLVLLVDGLDEDRGVTTGPDAHSIAALLPYGALDLPVVVSGRLNPPLPPDVPGNHPLRDPSIVRLLESSPKARAIRSEAERELKHFVEGGGLPYELLGLLTAAGGGLTADDLAELTGEIPYRVRDVLRTGPGRTFGLRGEAYLLAHEELVTGAREMLGARELGRWRAGLHDWAESWSERGWPDGTPEYLLHGYVPMLRATGDVDRAIACALDVVRHDRLLVATGGDGAALTEVRAAETLVAARGDRPDLVATLLRLAIRRDGLELRGGLVPPEVAAGWAAVGEPDRGLALARGVGAPRVVRALCTVAERLLARGDRAAAEEIAAEAEARAQDSGDLFARDDATARTARLLLALDAPERAERQIRRITDENERAPLLRGLVAEYGKGGAYERALRAAAEESHEYPRALARAETVGDLVRAGRVEEAERAVREPESNRAVRAFVLIRASADLDRAGHPERGAATLAEGLREWEEIRQEGAVRLGRELREALVAVGEFDRARRPHHDPVLSRDASGYAVALARQGEWERAWDVVDELPGGREQVMNDFARVLADAGDLDGAEEVDREAPGYVHDLWETIATGRLARDETDAVEAIAGRLTGSARGFELIGELVARMVAAGRVEQARAVVARMSGPEHELRLSAPLIGRAAEALHDAGHTAEARELLGRAEERSRRPSRSDTVRRLARIARALAPTELRERARLLLDAVDPHEDRYHRSVTRALLAVGEPVRALEHALVVDEFDQLFLVAEVVGGLVAAGERDVVERVLRERGHYQEDVMAAARAHLDAGAVDTAAAYALRLDLDVDVAGVRAEVAEALGRLGRRAEADRWLDEAVEAAWPRVATTAVMLPSVVRAQLALGRRDEAHALLRKATWAWTHHYGRLQPEHLLRAWVLFGAYDSAVELALSLPRGTTDRALSLLAVDLARAGRFEQAETVLAGLHHLGPGCAEGYTVLAVEHPDPAEARRLTGLALSLGPWYDALPAVLATAPDAVDLVLAEADRLRRALEV